MHESWSGLAMQAKAFPAGQILRSILGAAPALLQGSAPAEGAGLGVLRQDPSRQTALSVPSCGCRSQERLESTAKGTGA